MNEEQLWLFPEYETKKYTIGYDPSSCKYGGCIYGLGSVPTPLLELVTAGFEFRHLTSSLHDLKQFIKRYNSLDGGS